MSLFPPEQKTRIAGQRRTWSHTLLESKANSFVSLPTFSSIEIRQVFAPPTTNSPRSTTAATTTSIGVVGRATTSSISTAERSSTRPTDAHARGTDDSSTRERDQSVPCRVHLTFHRLREWLCPRPNDV